MTEYSGLAEIYDTLMQGINYDEWADYINLLVERHGGVPGKRALDIACGTGNTTLALKRAGYDVTGLDLAPEMLTIAIEKTKKERLVIPFVQADMREFSLSQPVGLVTSFQDGINYLLTADDFLQVMSMVARTLQSGGLFIFDINRVEKLPNSKEQVSFVDTGEFALVWETRFVQENIWEIAVTGFVATPTGLYRKFCETHRERAIPHQEVMDAIKTADLQLVGTYAAFSAADPDDSTRRVFYVVRKES